MTIRDWPEQERPREKLLERGAAALSDAELLALFLRVGVAGKSAVDLGRDLIKRFGSLTRLCNASAADFTAVPGMGLAKFAQLQAVLELSRRALKEDLRNGHIFDKPDKVRDWLRLRLAARAHEVFMVLMLDAQHRLVEAVELFRGTIDQTSVYPRDVVKLALDRSASAVILAHNHPSGAREPSSADLALTRSLRNALSLVDITLLDHFIVAGNQPPTSFSERGLL